MKIKKIKPTPDELSPSERAVMHFLQGYLQAHRRPPTIRQIAEQVNLSLGGTYDIVCRLEEYDYITRRQRRNGRRMTRNIRVTRSDG